MIRIPLFAHQQYGGCLGSVIQTNKKTTTVQISLDDKKGTKNIKVKNEWIDHVLNNNYGSFEQQEKKYQQTWVNQFIVVKSLGKGSFGSVDQVQKKSDAKQSFALKKIITTDFASVGISASLLEECVISLSVNHPNVVKSYDVMLTNHGHLYIVMEMLSCSLRGFQKEVMNLRPVPSYLIEFITSQILEGLHYMSSQWGIAHSDLSPNNILLDVEFRQSDQPKTIINVKRVAISDFSLSRSINGRTLPTRIVTIWYRAPELFSKYPSFTVAIDIWSLGMICLELFCGHPIFSSAKIEHITERIQEGIGKPCQEWMSQYGQFPSSLSEFKQPSLLNVLQPREPTRTYQTDKPFQWQTDHKKMKNLVQKMLVYDPTKRITALFALQQFFPTSATIRKSPFSLAFSSLSSSSLSSLSSFPYSSLSSSNQTPTLSSKMTQHLCHLVFGNITMPSSVSQIDITRLFQKIFASFAKQSTICQLSLICVAAMSLSIKYVIFKQTAAIFYPKFSTICKDLSLPYTNQDCVSAEVYLINHGAIQNMIQF